MEYETNSFPPDKQVTYITEVLAGRALDKHEFRSVYLDKAVVPYDLEMGTWTSLTQPERQVALDHFEGRISITPGDNDLTIRPNNYSI